MSADAVGDKDFRWIETDAALRELADEIASKIDEGKVTRSYLDTEADSLHHYQEKLCLIQLAADGVFALIDPLAVPDVTPLLEVLDRTEVWFHGADYDLTLLKRTYGWMPGLVRDTQIAARLTGHRAFGLAALVEMQCGVALCKSSQKADWSQRPLPAKMQAYAVDDVRYLATLAETFMAELRQKGRVPWFEQSCESLRNDVLNRQERGRDEAWRINGSGRLKPKGLALLRELWLWRDGMARDRDVPPFRILNNQQLLAMTAEYEENGKVSHPPRWRGRWKDTFQSVVERVQQSDPSSWPQRQKGQSRRMTDEDRDRVDRLCKTRDRKAEALGLEPSLLGSRGVMEDLVLRSEGEAMCKLMPWQREILGDAFQA